MTRALSMNINSITLEHLGVNLHSSATAALTEIVANSWDADAEHVDTNFNKEDGEVCIQDDGTGMTRDQVIDRFLTVGFRRRELDELTLKNKRLPMGRKGIGKLSSFSIAQCVTVYTISHGEKTAFRMDSKKIKEQMECDREGSYEPDEVNEWPQNLASGTRIILTGLKNTI